MVLMSLRTTALLAAVAALSACSSLKDLRLPSMPSWGSAPKAQVKTVSVAAPPALRPTDRTEAWQGIYRQQGDAGRFTECRSGADMPVAPAGDKALLASAYLAAQAAPGAPLLVEVQGRWVELARTDMPPSANAKELVLLVERFVSVSSRSSCANW